MKSIIIGKESVKLQVPAVAVGCMRIANMTDKKLNRYLHYALDNGVNFFDHADIYGGGKCEENFGRVLAADPSLKREDMIIQSKCGICKGYYDSSRRHIMNSVDDILKRLNTEYLDILLIHRPDALAQPEEIAAAFDELQACGKVRYFGVSNHRSSQIRLLKKYVEQDILINQMQLSLVVANMITSGIEANTWGDGANDRDGGLLDYCRLNDITVQTWSPFQNETHKVSFLNNPDYPELNQKLDELAQKYGVEPSTIAAAWILRHPAGFQLITGTTSEEHLQQTIDASKITLSRLEWYDLYRSAGHPTP